MTTLREYEIGIRLSPISTKMIMPIVTKIMMKIPIATKKFISLVFIRFTVPPIAFGIPETIPAKMIRLIPFPIPR